MKKTLLFAVCLFIHHLLLAQNISGLELLEKSINYHDPNDNWAGMNIKLTFVQESPSKGKYSRIVSFDNSKGTFSFQQKDDAKSIEFSLDNDQCSIMLNGSEKYTAAEAQEHKLTCDRVKMYRDYYTFLYGLPMKLKDDGTIIASTTMEKEFEGKTYLTMKVNYEESVGRDTWYFYFDKETYALSGYRFYHNESDNDGEFITLDGELTFNDIKIPKTRKWYVNKDRKYLGTDDLVLAEPGN